MPDHGVYRQAGVHEIPGANKPARRDPGKLVYETEMGILNLSEVVPLWLKKYEKS